MKWIYWLFLLLFLVGCRTTYVVKDSIGLERPTIVTKDNSKGLQATSELIKLTHTDEVIPGDKNYILSNPINNSDNVIDLSKITMSKYEELINILAQKVDKLDRDAMVKDKKIKILQYELDKSLINIKTLNVNLNNLKTLLNNKIKNLYYIIVGICIGWIITIILIIYKK